MSARIGRADRALLVAGGSIFAAMIAIAAFMARGRSDQIDAATTYSSRSGGLKAPYLLLKTLGYQSDRWDRPPSDLPDPATTTLILAEPLGSPTTRDKQALDEFMAHGGRVIATGIGGAYLIGGSAIPMFASDAETVYALSPSPITHAAPAITIRRSAVWSSKTFSMPLYGDVAETVVAEYPLGKGDAIWAADATPFSNAALSNQQNLEFLLACVGRPGERRVLWDEYFHGYRYSLSQSIWTSQVRWLIAQLTLLALVVLITYARRSGPTVMPATVSRLSPLEFVGTLGSLYRRAGATTVAVDIASERFRSWLSTHLGMRDTTAIGRLAEAAGRRPGVDAAGLAETLRACDAAHGSPSLPPKEALALVQALSRHAATLRAYSHSTIRTGRNT